MKNRKEQAERKKSQQISVTNSVSTKKVKNTQGKKTYL